MVTSVGTKAMGLAGGWRSMGTEEMKLVNARVLCGEDPRDPLALLGIYMAVLAHRYMGLKDVARLWQSVCPRLSLRCSHCLSCPELRCTLQCLCGRCDGSGSSTSLYLAWECKLTVTVCGPVRGMAHYL